MARKPLAGTLALGIWGMVGWPASASAQQTPAADMNAVAFMEGCWHGEMEGGRAIRERWGPAVGNVMLGTTLFLHGDSAVGHELAEILRVEDGRVRYTPYPDGDESPDPFFLTGVDAGSATFEAPEHDYPKRIRYRLLRQDRLEARIDGGPDDPGPGVWVMDRVPCDP